MGKISFKKMRLMAEERKITSYTIKVNKDVSISQSTWQQLKRDELSITTRTVAELCKLFQCQPGDLMEYVEDSTEDNKNDKV